MKTQVKKKEHTTKINRNPRNSYMKVQVRTMSLNRINLDNIEI